MPNLLHSTLCRIFKLAAYYLYNNLFIGIDFVYFKISDENVIALKDYDIESLISAYKLSQELVCGNVASISILDMRIILSHFLIICKDVLSFVTTDNEVYIFDTNIKVLTKVIAHIDRSITILNILEQSNNILKKAQEELDRAVANLLIALDEIDSSSLVLDNEGLMKLIHGNLLSLMPERILFSNDFNAKILANMLIVPEPLSVDGDQSGYSLTKILTNDVEYLRLINNRLIAINETLQNINLSLFEIKQLYIDLPPPPFQKITFTDVHYRNHLMICNDHAKRLQEQFDLKSIFRENPSKEPGSKKRKIEDVSGEDVSGEDVSGEDVSGKDVSGEDVSGKDVSEEDVYESKRLRQEFADLMEQQRYADINFNYE